MHASYYVTSQPDIHNKLSLKWKTWGPNLFSICDQTEKNFPFSVIVRGPLFVMATMTNIWVRLENDYDHLKNNFDLQTLSLKYLIVNVFVIFGMLKQLMLFLKGQSQLLHVLVLSFMWSSAFFQSPILIWICYIIHLSE